jgi:3-methyladenine DNA glycosylase AlkD
MIDQELIDGIRHGLRASADPIRAPKMQAYMKSAMPYLGVPLPGVRQIVRDALRVRPALTSNAVVGCATVLWRDAVYREERYAAAALVRVTKVATELDLLPLHQEMIVSGAWWDHVDEASHHVGDLLLAHPEAMRPVVLAWSVDPDKWLRRSSIICQVGHRGATDSALLSEVIAPNTDDRDFFIRKAIGWALRDYARTDPDWVRQFVGARRDELSPLSVREAMKHIL